MSSAIYSLVFNGCGSLGAGEGPGQQGQPGLWVSVLTLDGWCSGPPCRWRRPPPRGAQPLGTCPVGRSGSYREARAQTLVGHHSHSLNVSQSQTCCLLVPHSTVAPPLSLLLPPVLTGTAPFRLFSCCKASRPPILLSRWVRGPQHLPHPLLSPLPPSCLLGYPFENRRGAGWHRLHARAPRDLCLGSL